MAHTWWGTSGGVTEQWAIKVDGKIVETGFKSYDSARDYGLEMYGKSFEVIKTDERKSK